MFQWQYHWFIELYWLKGISELNIINITNRKKNNVKLERVYITVFRSYVVLIPCKENIRNEGGEKFEELSWVSLVDQAQVCWSKITEAAFQSGMCLDLSMHLWKSAPHLGRFWESRPVLSESLKLKITLFPSVPLL